MLQQFGWPAIILIFLAWVTVKVGRYLAPLVRGLFQAHVDLMNALQVDASEKTEILKSCQVMLERCDGRTEKHTVVLDSLSEKLDAAL